MYGITRLFSYPVPDVFAYSDNIADRTVSVFYSLFNNASAVRFPIKGNLCLDPALPKFCADR